MRLWGDPVAPAQFTLGCNTPAKSLAQELPASLKKRKILPQGGRISTRSQLAELTGTLSDGARALYFALVATTLLSLLIPRLNLNHFYYTPEPCKS